MDSHLRKSATCRVVSSSPSISFIDSDSFDSDSAVAAATVTSYAKTREPVLQSCGSERRNRLKLPKITEEWAEVNKVLEQTVVPMV